jgi:hypothetical protein
LYERGLLERGIVIAIVSEGRGLAWDGDGDCMGREEICVQAVQIHISIVRALL